MRHALRISLSRLIVSIGLNYFQVDLTNVFLQVSYMIFLVILTSQVSKSNIEFPFKFQFQNIY